MNGLPDDGPTAGDSTQRSETVDSEADGCASSRPTPVRMCVGCRGRAPKSDLVRVVVVENACVPDPTGHHAGRGAYLHHDQRCLELATRRRAFPRALRHAGPLALDAVVALVGPAPG